jgi:hypothetical protein
MKVAVRCVIIQPVPSRVNGAERQLQSISWLCGAARHSRPWWRCSTSVGGHNDENGYPAGEASRQAALGKLRKGLSDSDWNAGRMP